MEKLNFLNTREKQAYAALCLAKFCANHKIIHQSITELIEHLLSILICQSLPNWEQKGAILDITGRGVPIPTSVESAIPDEYLKTFRHLVEYTVEVGIVDMYGATTNEPLRFLHKCIDILIVDGIDPPKIENLFDSQSSAETKNGDWGSVISTSEYEKIITTYKDI